VVDFAAGLKDSAGVGGCASSIEYTQVSKNHDNPSSA
jgi:hypothetical protein